MAPRLRIEVVYALPEAQEVVALDLSPGACVQDAVEASGLARRLADTGAAGMRLGVFGRKAAPGRLLRDGDRVEILRPLAADPKEARRRRARRRG